MHIIRDFIEMLLALLGVHVFMMSLYAAVTAIVLATVDPKAETRRERIIHGLKIFGWFMGIGLVLSWILYPIPW